MRIRLNPTIAAPTARAKIAVWVVRDLGELDIKVLEKGGAPARGATTGDSAGASDRPGSNRGHSTRSAFVSRVQDGMTGHLLTTAPPVRATISAMDGRRSMLRVVAAIAGLLAAAVAAGPVLAHGPVPAEPPTAASLLLGWTWEPIPTLAIVVTVAWWLWAVRRVDAVHPRNPVPRRRTVAFLAGMLAIAFALISGIERYDTILFSVHMIQHVLLMLVAAPLLALAAPVTLVLRLSSAETRRRWLLPILHSRVVRFLAHPIVAWLMFASMMWATHFSPLFNASLEDPLIHDVEHMLFLSGALLFWWPAVALDPAPWRMSHPARIGYLFTQMTQNTFLAVVILNATTVLYPHYASLVRPWGMAALEDQRLAAGIMWIVGDAIFLTAILAVVAGWMRAEARNEAREDRRAGEELTQIRLRERRLAERLAEERGETGR
jgi:putative copper resistance protein D